MCGLHNELIQKRLLSEPDLSLAKASEIAFAMEAAAKDTLELQGNINKESEVNKLTRIAKQFTKGKMMLNQNLIVIDVGEVHISQPSVTSGVKHAENVGN